MYSTLFGAKMDKFLCSIYQCFKLLFQHYVVLEVIVFYIANAYTVCGNIAQNAR